MGNEVVIYQSCHEADGSKREKLEKVKKLVDKLKTL